MRRASRMRMRVSTITWVVPSGDVWPGAADDDGLRGSKEGDDNIEE